MTKVALVTGSSSGIGYETFLMLARNHFATYASMRNLKKCDIRIVVYNANYSVGRHVLQIFRNLYINYAQFRNKQ